MSTKAKVTFGTSCIITAAIVSYVHITHKIERDAVKVGVQMDLERQQKKKENLQLFEDQKKLTAALIKAGKEDQS